MDGVLRDHSYSLRLPKGLSLIRRYRYIGILDYIYNKIPFDCCTPISKAYKCEFCLFTTSIRIIYMNHINQKHSLKGITGYRHIQLNSKGYTCDQCDICTFSQLILLKHICTRDIIKFRNVFYVCYLCHFTVGGKQKFIPSRKKESKFECDQCEFTTRSSEILFVHTNVHHPPCTSIIVKHILDKHDGLIENGKVFFKCIHLSTNLAGDLNIKFWEFAQKWKKLPSHVDGPTPSSKLVIESRIVHAPLWK